VSHSTSKITNEELRKKRWGLFVRQLDGGKVRKNIFAKNIFVKNIFPKIFSSKIFF